MSNLAFLSMITVCGMPSTWKVVTRLPLRIKSHRETLPVLLFQEFLDLLGFSPWLTATKTTLFSGKEEVAFIRAGKARTQGPHQVAQKSKTTTFPFCLDRSNSFPSKRFALSPGAGKPINEPEAFSEAGASEGCGRPAIPANSSKSEGRTSTFDHDALFQRLSLDPIEDGGCLSLLRCS